MAVPARSASAFLLRGMRHATARASRRITIPAIACTPLVSSSGASIPRITPSIQLISHHPPAFPPHRYASTDSACPAESELAELTPTPLELNQFHALANYTLDHILFSLEALCDLSPDMPPTNVELSDVEFSADVLTITTDRGIWLLNKQPPNRQLWLSSPISGPRRFDWIAAAEGGEKGEEGGEGLPRGRWVCLRKGDGYGTSLGEYLKREIGEGVEVGGEEQ